MKGWESKTDPTGKTYYRRWIPIVRMAQRDQSIDAFRGLSIILMVFFTATLKLSNELPEVIRHNVRGSFHVGDMVLPMFLFASGLSMVFFLEKYGRERQIVGKRFLKLVLIGIMLSHWSTRGFLEMDEVMLSALLFMGCFLLSDVDHRVLLALILVIDLSYGLVLHFGWDNVFREYYLGGYYSVPYYFPVMLAGMMVGRNTLREGLPGWRNGSLILTICGALFISFAIAPADKLEATPAFMMASILFSFIILTMVHAIVSLLPDLGELEYLGRKPIRYWVMMYVGFMIPLLEWRGRTDGNLPLEQPWEVAVIGSLTLLMALWLASKVIDIFAERNERS
jgi:hypothetical protein